MSTRSHIHRLLLVLSIVAALPLAATAASSASHRPPCAGEEATIVGTAGDGTLLSTLILGAVFLTESPEFLIGYELTLALFATACVVHLVARARA